MIVVFGDKIQMVQQPHRGLQARVRESLGEQRCVQFIDALQQRRAGGAELNQKSFQRARVVVRVIGLSIRQIRGREFPASGGVIFQARKP